MKKIANMENCNICDKLISSDEFENGMGECLECFPMDLVLKTVTEDETNVSVALRQNFADETKTKLWAENGDNDCGFSESYVFWLEEKLLESEKSKRLLVDILHQSNRHKGASNEEHLLIGDLEIIERIVTKIV